MWSNRESKGLTCGHCTFRSECLHEALESLELVALLGRSGSRAGQGREGEGREGQGRAGQGFIRLATDPMSTDSSGHTGIFGDYP